MYANLFAKNTRISLMHFPLKAGQSTSCLPQTTSGFSLSSNATSGEISTCDPWGLIIEGGQSPYTVSLAAEGSPSVTNVTMSPGDNLYTYINRAGPNGALLAAISDSAGKWASGASYVKTKGSTDTTCSTSDAATPSQTNGDMTLRVHSIVSLLAAGVMMKLFF
ncbi:hypothetical protein H0H87_010554 [Tephrocybe sp. NHM501043]|nr:hypothetical protein H0H87_010554 [Tephrocybe sp. NHM501043]